jgi:hypothetical protein
MKTPINIMKNLQLLLIMMAFVLSSAAIAENKNIDAIAGKKKIEVRTSEPDAEIFMNGRKVGSGNALIVVPNEDCVVILIKKETFLTEKIEFCNKKDLEKLPKTQTVQMRLDDSYEATVYNENINQDITLKCETIDKDQAWKLINQILLSHVDVIEMMDKETGYLNTEWTIESFIQNTVRARVIIKETSLNPLVFKVKVVSECSGQAQTPLRSDLKFKEWDRVLKNYKDIVPELQARLK